MKPLIALLLAAGIINSVHAEDVTEYVVIKEKRINNDIAISTDGHIYDFGKTVQIDRKKFALPHNTYERRVIDSKVDLSQIFVSSDTDFNIKPETWGMTVDGKWYSFWDKEQNRQGFIAMNKELLREMLKSKP